MRHSMLDAKNTPVLMASEMRRLGRLEDENAKLKRFVADLSLDKAMLQDVVSRL